MAAAPDPGLAARAVYTVVTGVRDNSTVVMPPVYRAHQRTDTATRTDAVDADGLAGLVTPTPPLTGDVASERAYDAFMADPFLYTIPIVDAELQPIGSNRGR